MCFSNQLTVPKEDAPPPPLPCTCTVTIVAQENEEMGSSGECHSCSANLFKRYSKVVPVHAISQLQV